MVPFLPRSTFSCTLALAAVGFAWNPPHLRDCVDASPSDIAAPLPGMSFHIFLRMEDAGLPVSGSATQLLAECSRPGERLSLGDVDPVERLGLTAAGILPGYPFSCRASNRLGGYWAGHLKYLYWKPANLRGPERRWFLHPSVSHRETILNVASEHVMLAGGVCLACVPPLPNNSPDRAWPDSAPPLGMLSTLVEWAVMRLLRSSFVEIRPVHIILTNLRQRRCPVP